MEMIFHTKSFQNILNCRAAISRSNSSDQARLSVVACIRLVVLFFELIDPIMLLLQVVTEFTESLSLPMSAVASRFRPFLRFLVRVVVNYRFAVNNGRRRVTSLQRDHTRAAQGDRAK